MTISLSDLPNPDVSSFPCIQFISLIYIHARTQFSFFFRFSDKFFGVRLFLGFWVFGRLIRNPFKNWLLRGDCRFFFFFFFNNIFRKFSFCDPGVSILHNWRGLGGLIREPCWLCWSSSAWKNWSNRGEKLSPLLWHCLWAEFFGILLKLKG